MKRRPERILTTHAGSLARPDDLRDMLTARNERRPYDTAAFASRVRSAVGEVVRQQIGIGLLAQIYGRDAAEFPEYFAGRGNLAGQEAVCVGPLRYIGHAEPRAARHRAGACALPRLLGQLSRPAQVRPSPARFRTLRGRAAAPSTPAPGVTAHVAIRPEDIAVAAPGGTTEENALTGTIEALLFVGDRYEARVALGGEQRILLLLPRASEWREGQRLQLAFPPDLVSVWSEGTR